MNHQQVEAEGIVERYLSGMLSADEEERFEEHYLTCALCQDGLELGQRFDRAVQAVAREKVGEVAPVVRRWRGGWGGRSSLPLAAALAVALVGLGLLWQRSEHWRAEAERWSQPRAGTLLLALSPERSTSSGEAPDVRLTLGEGPRWLVLSLTPGQGGGERYRGTLLGPGGEVRWQSDELHAGAGGAVVVSLPSSFLAPGDYQLRLQPLSAAGEPGPGTRFAFRVQGAPGVR